MTHVPWPNSKCCRSPTKLSKGSKYRGKNYSCSITVITCSLYYKAPVTKRRGIGPIRTEISPYKIRKKFLIFQSVRFNGICIWQNNFCILPNFGDFGTKTSFFRYLINQKRNYFIKHCSPRVSTSRLYQRCIYIYIRHYLYKWGLDTRGEQCSTAKKWGEGQLTTHEIRYNQRKITSIVNFLIKAWNFA